MKANPNIGVASDRQVIVLTTMGRGGIRSVVDTLERDQLGSRWNPRTLYTHVEGSLVKRLWTAFYALLTFLGLLFRGRVALVHCHVAMRGSFWRKTLFASIARSFGVPVVFHLHGSEMKAFFAAQRPWVQRIISTQLETVDHVVVLSDSWRDYVVEIAPRAKVTVVPNYVVLPDDSECREAHDGLRFLFLGLLGERKGIYDLLVAFSRIAGQIPNAKLLVGGNGEEQQVRQKVSEAALNDQVEVLGWVSGDLKLSLLRTSDVFVLPSYNEGLPVSILEAMSWRIPVISTRVGGIPQLLRHEVDGLLIEAGDIDSLADALLRLGSNSALRIQMGDSARERVEMGFSRERAIPILEGLYETLIGKSSV